MKTLLTGGLGYIGSHVAINLINAGYEIVIVDNLSNSNIKTLKLIEKIVGKSISFHLIDVRNYQELNKLFKAQNFESVVHLSGLKAVGESVIDPLRYYENNVSGSINLFKCMKKNNVKKLVFSSSATVYGNPQYLPIDENHPINPINPYGKTKAKIEGILEDLHTSDNDFAFISLRYFNPIGSHKSGLIGDSPEGIPNNLMPYILKVFNKELDILNVFGDDYKTPDGTGIRDYIHITDLANGHLNALNALSKNNKISQFINLGTGKGFSVFDVIKSFEDISKFKIPYKVCSRRPGDAESCYADPSKAKEILNWEADLTLNDMTKSALKFIQKNKLNI